MSPQEPGTPAGRPYVVYRLVAREGGKADKLPLSPDTLQPADAQSPTSWLDRPAAEALAAALGDGYGVGIVITADSGLWALDLDNAWDGSAWAPWVEPLVAAFPGAYVEVSVSGRGLHIMGSYVGPRPLHGTRCSEIRGELYTGGRFIALGQPGATGSIDSDHTAALHRLIAERFPARAVAASADAWTDGPIPGYGIADDAELIERASRSRSAGSAFGGRASFADLWAGNVDALARSFPPQQAGQAYDASAADLALASHLSFWTGGDCERIARLLASSGLARPKHDREDYLRSTVLRACAGATSWYSAHPAPGAVQTASAGVVPPSAPVTAPDGHILTIGSKGRYEATLPNLEAALTAQETTRIGLDTFRERIMIAPAGSEDWRPLTDDDMIRLRNRLEKVERFAPISSALMRDALRLVALNHVFDSAQTWLAGLVWDGVPRVGRFLADYCGSVDDDYTRAVSAYIWTGLAGRVISPGCQLDMVVALQSPQGRQKSTGLQAMVPDAEHFTDGVSLHQDNDDFKRLLRGKLVVEIAELAGLSRADVNVVKRTITRRAEEWVEKYATQPTTFPRRCMLFATTNEERFLPPDETGNRRWLPVEITRIDRDRIAADRLQLWAEGAATYRAAGIAWQEAERLAAGRHAAYEASDIWEAPISAWLATAPPPGAPGPQGAPGDRPLTIPEVLAGALRMSESAMDVKAEKRVARVLRQLGYARTLVRTDGGPARRWVRPLVAG